MTRRGHSAVLVVSVFVAVLVTIPLESYAARIVAGVTLATACRLGALGVHRWWQGRRMHGPGDVAAARRLAIGVVLLNAVVILASTVVMLVRPRGLLAWFGGLLVASILGHVVLAARFRALARASSDGEAAGSTGAS